MKKFLFRLVIMAVVGLTIFLVVLKTLDDSASAVAAATFFTTLIALLVICHAVDTVSTTLTKVIFGIIVTANVIAGFVTAYGLVTTTVAIVITAVFVTIAAAPFVWEKINEKATVGSCSILRSLVAC